MKRRRLTTHSTGASRGGLSLSKVDWRFGPVNSGVRRLLCAIKSRSRDIKTRCVAAIELAEIDERKTNVCLK
jgi:hypothetical protein